MLMRKFDSKLVSVIVAQERPSCFCSRDSIKDTERDENDYLAKW